MSRGNALGFIESVGLASAIAAADAALKAANVRLIGRENSRGFGYITIKIAGEVGAVKAAIDAARAASGKVARVWSTDVIPRPAQGLGEVMVWNDETAGPEEPEQTDPAGPQEPGPSDPAPTEPAGPDPTDPSDPEPTDLADPDPAGTVAADQREPESPNETTKNSSELASPPRQDLAVRPQRAVAKMKNKSGADEAPKPKGQRKGRGRKTG